MNIAMTEGERRPDAYPCTASLEYKTGPSRGMTTFLGGAAVDVLLSEGRRVSVVESGAGEPPGDLVARLHPAGDTYELEADAQRPVWVNGTRVTARRLENGDMIEFGDTGPLSRFRVYGTGRAPRKTTFEILGDCAAYIRSSRQPPLKRAYRGVSNLVRQMTRETTLLFRTTVIVAVLVLAALTYQQSRFNTLLQQRIESGTARLDSFAAAIARAKEQALRPSDFEALRRDLAGQLSRNAERLAALENRSRASARIIAEASPSVLFLQGAYGFRERSTKRMLRQMTDEEGNPLISPIGQPLLSLDGNGPVAERQFTGTGFVVGDEGALITNRHVALPWENDGSSEMLALQGLEPVMIRLIGYRPGNAIAVPLELRLVRKDADLAILRRTDDGATLPGLKLAVTASAPGDEIIVMGYPTGLRAMLAQSGEAFIDELQKTRDIGFWTVAARLASAGFIAPLSSRGIVGQVTSSIVVYDAETSQGGSGGPVLATDGSVIAVNTAMLSESGGSNLGVPAPKVRELLAAAGDGEPGG